MSSALSFNYYVVIVYIIVMDMFTHLLNIELRIMLLPLKCIPSPMSGSVVAFIKYLKTCV